MSVDLDASPSPSPSPEFDADYSRTDPACGAFYAIVIDRFERASLGLVLSTAAFSIGLCLVMAVLLFTTRRLSLAVDALKAESHSTDDARNARKTLLVKDARIARRRATVDAPATEPPDEL